MANKPFSEELEGWVKDHRPKTLASLEHVFAEKSFAIVILLLIAPSALPLPTGGVTNVLEIIVMLLALELIIGRKVIWLPKKWLKLQISGKTEEKLVPALAKRVHWMERFSKPRLAGLLNDSKFLQLTGLMIFVLAFGAFLAPPFSWLDTLPSLGVVLICLSLILEDALVYVIGCIVGGLGVALEVRIGQEIIGALKDIF